MNITSSGNSGVIILPTQTSCTTVDGSEILHHVKNVVNNGINYLSTGAGFLNHQQY